MRKLHRRGSLSDYDSEDYFGKPSQTANRTSPIPDSFVIPFSSLLCHWRLRENPARRKTMPRMNDRIIT